MERTPSIRDRKPTTTLSTEIDTTETGTRTIVPHRTRELHARGARTRLAIRVVEMVVLFFVLPASVWMGGWLDAGSKWVIPSAIGFGLLAALYLAKQPSFDIRHRWVGNPHSIRPVLMRFAISGSLLLITTAIFLPDKLFSFPRTNPRFWLLVMCAYPVVSVLGQEVIYRAFFFRRYRPIFLDDRPLIFVSALAFGMVHILFGQWQSVVLSTIGGIYFAHTYVRTRSVRTACLEHALYGDLVFTIGLQEFFYSGAAKSF